MSFQDAPANRPNARRIRPAEPRDHAEFQRLCPELAVDDPPIEEARFLRELLPTMLVVEGAGGARGPLAGYTFFQLLNGVAYVRHIVTAPEARRTGVGRALMSAVAERARAAGCTSWCLNVKPGNTAARALYESVGLRPAFESQAMKITWAQVDAAERVQNAHITARPIEPADDARVEAAMKMMSGQLATARAMGGRVLTALHEGDDVVAASVFDPAFPGAYPFRAARPELALALLRALQPHALPAIPFVKMVSEGERWVTDALVAAGAEVTLDILHMKGPLPAA